MKEQTLIEKLNRGANERLQNNQMIQHLMQELQLVQEFTTGLLSTMRKMPGYKEAISELAAENMEKAKDMEVVDATEVKAESKLILDNPEKQ